MLARMNWACSILVLGGVSLVSPRMAQAQMPVVTAYYPAAPAVTYLPERFGLFGLRTAYRPVVSYPWAAGFVAPAPVTAYYAPVAPVTAYYPAAPVTTYYAPAPVTTYYAPPVAAPAPVTTYYAPAPVTTYYAPPVAAPVAAPVTVQYAPTTTYSVVLP